MLVSSLAAALEFHPWPERTSDNPFFPRFAKDRPAWAFHSQAAFILGAMEDANAARRRLPGGVLERPAREMLDVFVVDLYEDGLLSGEELDVLARAVALGEELAGVPDLLVILGGDPERLLDRVRSRDAPGDRLYDLADMGRLAARYEHWRGDWDRCPVVDVDTTATDLRLPEEIDKLAARVRIQLGSR